VFEGVFCNIFETKNSSDIIEKSDQESMLAFGAHITIIAFSYNIFIYLR
jgi:hypothetical protein